MYQISIILLLSLGLWTYQDDVMRVKKGEVFKIVLKSNHSTGYSWHWNDRPSNSIIDSIYVTYVLEKKMLTGAGGHEIWEFRARTEGQQKISLVYKRPWEEGESTEIKEVLVKVE